jgi:hypothetical protein
VTVGNGDSTGSATGVVLTVALPTGAEVVSTSAGRGPGCTGGQPVTCPLDFIPGGRTATVTIVARQTARGTLTATASVSADQPAADPASTQGSATVTVAGKPRLSVTAPASARSAGTALVVTAALAIDEPATATLRVRDARGRTVTLLAGSRLAGAVLQTSRLQLTAATGAGAIPIAARLPAGTGPGRLALRTTDRDGRTSTLSLPFRP